MTERFRLKRQDRARRWGESATYKLNLFTASILNGHSHQKLCVESLRRVLKNNFHTNHTGTRNVFQKSKISLEISIFNFRLKRRMFCRCKREKRRVVILLQSLSSFFFHSFRSQVRRQLASPSPFPRSSSSQPIPSLINLIYPLESWYSSPESRPLFLTARKSIQRRRRKINKRRIGDTDYSSASHKTQFQYNGVVSASADREGRPLPHSGPIRLTIFIPYFFLAPATERINYFSWTVDMICEPRTRSWQQYSKDTASLGLCHCWSRNSIVALGAPSSVLYAAHLCFELFILVPSIVFP